MTGNKDDASDITQEVFIQAIQSVNHFRGDSQVYTWLYRIAKNKCLRFLKKKNQTTFLSLQGLVDTVSSPVPDEISETDKLRYISQVKDGCLSGLIRCLSIQQRLAFILSILFDLPVKQVADIIGKSENATRILVHRSKQNIKNFLCRNCSLYDSTNPCHCENLVNFSLKQGWISLNSGTAHIADIETEIKDMKRVVSLYKTLQDELPADDLTQQIRQMLSDKENFLILSEKKVKYTPGDGI